MTSIAQTEAPAGTGPGGHPRGLYVLFGAEMWERFSYYGMRALLVLYLVNYLRWDDFRAKDLYAIYTGLVYLTPLLGGFLADRYLGQRKAILVGGIVMALGHFAMAFEPLLYQALGLLIVGNGFFKPNISTMVGQLYPQGDARRDVGYTIFYMGINLGAGLAPLVCGTLGERVGWHWGFGAAGVGMVLGLLNFLAFQRTLGPSGYAPDLRDEDRRLRPVDWAHVALITLACVGVVAAGVALVGPISGAVSGGLVRPLVLLSWLGLAAALIAVTHLMVRGLGSRRPDPGPIEAARTGGVAVAVEPGRGQAEAAGADAPVEDEDPNAPFTAAQWQRIAVILIVATFSIVFWMGFEQAGSTLNLFADRQTDRSLPAALHETVGTEFPASWYQSVNPWLIIAFAPLFSMLWSALDRTRLRINSAAKMGLGLILLGLGFTVMYQADRLAGGSDKVGPQWLAFVYLLNTLGELCLSPIGLSLVNKLSPARIASLMMATWFLCTAIANYLAGKLEEYLHGTDINLWVFLIASSIIPGLILLVLSPLLKKMSHGRL